MLKFKVLSITRKVTPFLFKYYLSQTVLENIPRYNDLGVTVDKGLVFNKHDSNVINKCNSLGAKSCNVKISLGQH